MSWAAQSERGTPWLLRTGLATVRRCGATAGRAIVLGSVAWFLATSPQARRASRDYLGRALGRAATWREVARHFDQFGWAILDRVMLLTGPADAYRIEVEGLEALLATLRRGQGALLLGAHLGSFEVLRSLASRAPVPVWALMYQRNAGALTALLDQVAPELRERVIEIGDTASMLRARECVERGEIVGILADRAPPGHRPVPACFLGATAPFPAGPFILAATLRAPVFLFYAVRVGKRRYRIGIEPFAEKVALRREQRMADLRFYVERYAAALEGWCRAYPYQWFNFFPFWDSDFDDARDGAPAPVAAAPARLSQPRPG